MEARMERIGVRELKEHASEIVRRVREQRNAYEITYRGRTVARLVPVSDSPQSADRESYWAELDRVAAEIGSRWPHALTAADAVREQRRDP
jgi:prevent-host-death family protein